MKPLCIDLYCGLGGWAEGFLSEGYRVIGFDIERHDYGTGGYPGQLALQDVRSLHGSQFKDAAVIVGSSPCQKYSYMAMPWSKAKKLFAWYSDTNHPERLAELNELFDAQFRIQREASVAAGRHVPLIVENVRGAQRWVGRAKWHFGSYYLWGDVPALMPVPANLIAKVTGQNWNAFKRSGLTLPHWRLEGLKCGDASQRRWEDRTIKRLSDAVGTKQGGDWFGSECDMSMSRRYSSKSPQRKLASALIAKIPFPLAHWIARCFKPDSDFFPRSPPKVGRDPLDSLSCDAL